MTTTSTVDTGGGRPRGLTDEELAIARRSGPVAVGREPAPDEAPAPPLPAPAEGGRPALHPPGTPGATASTEAGALTAVTVLALFTTDRPATGWVHVDGTGWLRLAGPELIPIAAAARAASGAALVRLGAGDTVAEMYVW